MDDLNRPVRLLSLDGGDVRGLSELIILSELMERVNKTRRLSDKLEPWQLFDMIGGTGTGGFVAIMLGCLRMTVKECILAYLDYSEAILKPKRSKWNALLKPKFRSTIDQDTMNDIIRRRSHSFTSLDESMRGSDSPCKVFVVASRADAGHESLLRSYQNPLSFPREIHPSLWEAARATMASSAFFEPLRFKAEDDMFDFGAARYQNPVEFVYSEARDLWSGGDILLVSIGAGAAPQNKFSGSMRANIEAVEKMSIDAETIAHNFEHAHTGTKSRTSYYRFNVLDSFADIGLEEHGALYRMESMTQRHLQRADLQDRLRRCVDELSEINYEEKSNTIQKLERQQAQEIEFQKLADWLSPVDMSATQNDVIAKLQEGTGASLLPTSSFRSWLQGEIQTLLCLGIPGIGKTVLAAQVIDTLLKDEGYKGNPVLYFFADVRTQEAEQQSPTSILAILLKQFILCNRSVSDETRWFSERHIKGGNRPDAQGLLVCLEHERAKSHKVFVVIDALDELSESCSRDILGYLRKLQEKRTVLLMVTSRPTLQTEEIFDAAFPEYQTLQIDPTQNDMEAYLLGQMTRLPDVVMQRTDIQEYIRSEIMRISGGRFLITKLLLDYLVPLVTVRQIKSALSSLPRDLWGIYRATLARIEDQDRFSRNVAFRVFSWLSYAQRPITAQELQHALAVEADKAYLDDENMVDIEVLTSVCGGLVVVTADSNFITFVHVTAEDFFKNFRTTRFPDGHFDIAITCLRYLCFDCFAEGRCLGNEDLQRRMDERPFLDYAAHFWGVHVGEVPAETVMNMDAALKLLTDDRLISCCSQVMLLQHSRPPLSSETSPEGVTGLHLVAYFGLQKLARRLLERGSDIGARDSNGRNPMSWAVERNQIQMVQFFLELGSDINMRDHQGLTHLTLAAVNGYDEMAEVLLLHDADASVRDHTGQTAVSLAATYGNLTLLRIFTDKTLGQLDSKDRFARTPLFCAAENGRDDVVTYLISQGAVDVNTRDAKGQTPLMTAARRGQIGVVKILLAHPNTEVNLQDLTGRTALMWAVIEGQLEVLRLLHSHGDAEEALSLADYSGRTPLEWATIENRESTRELLKIRSGSFENRISENPRGSDVTMMEV